MSINEGFRICPLGNEYRITAEGDGCAGFNMMTALKDSVVTALAACLILFASCSKQPGRPSSPAERELSVPEKVEAEFMHILSGDWKGLSDTLDYFCSTLLSRGLTEGTGPDGVRYKLSARLQPEAEASFMVEDSTWLRAWGKIVPLDMKVHACGAEISVKCVRPDSVSLSAYDLRVIAPWDFLVRQDHRAPLSYAGRRVGCLTRESFENSNYSAVTGIVVRYDDDPRSFSFHEGGIAGLLKMILDDVSE